MHLVNTVLTNAPVLRDTRTRVLLTGVPNPLEIPSTTGRAACRPKVNGCGRRMLPAAIDRLVQEQLRRQRELLWVSENYLVDRALPFARLAREFTPTSSRAPIYTGSGKVGCEMEGPIVVGSRSPRERTSSKRRSV